MKRRRETEQPADQLQRVNENSHPFLNQPMEIYAQIFSFCSNRDCAMVIRTCGFFAFDLERVNYCLGHTLDLRIIQAYKLKMRHVTKHWNITINLDCGDISKRREQAYIQKYLSEMSQVSSFRLLNAKPATVQALLPKNAQKLHCVHKGEVAGGKTQYNLPSHLTELRFDSQDRVLRASVIEKLPKLTALTVCDSVGVEVPPHHQLRKLCLRNVEHCAWISRGPMKIEFYDVHLPHIKELELDVPRGVSIQDIWRRLAITPNLERLSISRSKAREAREFDLELHTNMTRLLSLRALRLRDVICRVNMTSRFQGLSGLGVLAHLVPKLDIELLVDVTFFHETVGSSDRFTHWKFPVLRIGCSRTPLFTPNPKPYLIQFDLTRFKTLILVHHSTLPYDYRWAPLWIHEPFYQQQLTIDIE